MPLILRFSRVMLAGKSIEVHGVDRLVREGPSLIVGNHCGAYKDVVTLFRVIPRPIFFNANKQLFSRAEFSYLVRKHLKRHMGRFGLAVNFLLNPYKSLFVDFVAANIAKVGTIPVDLKGGKQEAIRRCEDYVRMGRALVALNGRGRVDPIGRNPYIWPFGRGSALIAYHLRENEGLDVPVTPLAMFGTQLPWLIPGTIHVNFGAPLFVRDYLGGGLEASVERFKDALETRVHELFMQLIHA